ncbi:hypothetical protein ACFL17_10645 [Pseudomonadota bacterium]
MKVSRIALYLGPLLLVLMSSQVVSAGTLSLKHKLHVKPGAFKYYSSCTATVTDSDTGKPVAVDKITAYLRHERKYPKVEKSQVNSSESVAEFKKSGWGSYWIVANCHACAEKEGFGKWCTDEDDIDPSVPADDLPLR